MDDEMIITDRTFDTTDTSSDPMRISSLDNVPKSGLNEKEIAHWVRTGKLPATVNEMTEPDEEPKSVFRREARVSSPLSTARIITPQRGKDIPQQDSPKPVVEPESSDDELGDLSISLDRYGEDNFENFDFADDMLDIFVIKTGRRRIVKRIDKVVGMKYYDQKFDEKEMEDEDGTDSVLSIASYRKVKHISAKLDFRIESASELLEEKLEKIIVIKDYDKRSRNIVAV